MVTSNGREELSRELKSIRQELSGRFTDAQIVDLVNTLLRTEYRAEQIRIASWRRERGLPEEKPKPFTPIGSRRALNGWLNAGTLPAWPHLWAVIVVMHQKPLPPRNPAEGIWRALYDTAASSRRPGRGVVEPPARVESPAPAPKLPEPQAKWSRRIVIGVVVVALVIGVGLVVRLIVGDGGRAQAGEDLPFVVETSMLEAVNAFVFRQGPAELSGAPTMDRRDFQRWADERGGIASDFDKLDDEATTWAGHGIQIELWARSADEPVTLQDLDIKVVERKPGLVGTLVYPTSSGGSKWGRYVTMNVDTDPPTVVESRSGVKTEFGDLRAEPMQFPYDLTAASSELFLVWARTHQYVRWQIRLRWSTKTRSGETIIDNHGKPFEVSYPGTGSASCAYFAGAAQAGTLHNGEPAAPC
ncbi:hypothetical protein ACIA5E_00350 [Nocardia asteroides]|uniref:hypothetical protein n=1 Tax=Nocardia asteroides TaxID=1824 RepID=UPI0037B81DB9